MRANEALAVFGPLGGRDDGLLAAASTLVFLPVESFWPSAGRWVTPEPPKRSSESDFDSGGHWEGC
jgi:hypothetical protein